MFFIARARLKEDPEFDPDEPYGVSIVARKLEPDRYTAVIWHEHYPYVFKYLGLEQQAAPPAGGTTDG